MPAPAMSYVLSYITQIIPKQLLEAAFRSRHYNTTIEQRIISQVIEGPVVLDTNLVGGKLRYITMNANWLMPLDHVESYGIVGSGIEASYYCIPDYAREYRNISSVLGVTAIASSGLGSGVSFGTQNFGNSAVGLLSEMLGTHTMRNTAIMPQVTLEGTNILRFFPELLTDGLAVRVMLEHDSEFLNMSNSAILALRKLCLCAVQRYIVKELIVPVDETEVVAGMEIGIVKTLIMEYKQESERYDELLIKLKGAMHSDPQSIRRLMYYAV